MSTNTINLPESQEIGLNALWLFPLIFVAGAIGAGGLLLNSAVDLVYRRPREKISLKLNPLTPGCDRILSRDGWGQYGKLEVIYFEGKDYLIENGTIPAFRPGPFASPHDWNISVIRGELKQKGKVYFRGDFLDHSKDFYDYEEISLRDPRFNKLKKILSRE